MNECLQKGMTDPTLVARFDYNGAHFEKRWSDQLGGEKARRTTQSSWKERIYLSIIDILLDILT